MTALARAEPKPHRFTYDEVIAAVRAGAIGGDCRWELMDGELIDMPADGPRHNEWTGVLGRWLYSRIGPEHTILPNATLVLSERDAPSPDWQIYPSGMRNADVRGPDVLLLIEQGDSSLSRDLRVKAGLYARHGVREYWVIDLEMRRLHVHRGPTPDGYADVSPPYGAEDAVEALLIPGLVLRLSDLPPVS